MRTGGYVAGCGTCGACGNVFTAVCHSVQGPLILGVSYLVMDGGRYPLQSWTGGAPCSPERERTSGTII